MAQVSSRKFVIIGGGVIGLSAAYHLGKLGETDAILLERNQLTSGTSWHAAGIIGPLRAGINMTRIASYATDLLPQLERETGQSTGYTQTGGYWLARTQDRLREFHHIAAIGEMTGIEAEIIDAHELELREPYVRTDDLAGALFVPTDAQANPVDICMAYAKAARRSGIELRENACVVDILVSNGAISGVQLGNGETIHCEKLLLCAGAWSHHIGAMAGVPVPLQAVEHMYVVTEPVPTLPNPFPVMRDIDGWTYIKGDAGKLVIGGFEPNAKPWNPLGPDGDRAFLELPEDWDQFETFMTCALERLPVLNDVGIQYFMNGPESFTPDTRQLLGESPFVRNFYVAAGMNSTGMMSSAGIGKALAEWAIAGEAPFDLWDIDIARFGREEADTGYLNERMQEAVADVFAMHWPHKQAEAGRHLRRTALHRQFVEADAFFGVTGGWERPLWFAQCTSEQTINYSYAEQNWWPAAQRECDALQNNVALLELSPFGKFDVSGRDAMTFLQQLCANNIDVEIGHAVYGQFLNNRGGIEADITVSRIAPNRFRVISGAATRFRDLRWMQTQRHLLQAEVRIEDVTDRETVLGVVGPRSRLLLQIICDTDFSISAFPFSTSQLATVDGIEIRASRISFSGELGWELYIPVEASEWIYNKLIEAGREFQLAHAGHLALLSCSIEKGFRHWGHELGPDETPLEAGLGFTVAWNKPGGFIGKDALLAQRERGVEKHLLMFEVNGAHPLILHDEPVYCDGRRVGATTSGARGFRTGKSLCMAYVHCDVGETKQQLLERSYEVSVAGERYSLNGLGRVPYDPDGRKMRG